MPQLVGREQYLLAQHFRAKKITDKVRTGPPGANDIPFIQAPLPPCSIDKVRAGPLGCSAVS